MSVTQVRQAVGSWSVRLRGNIPRSVLDALEYFGHVVVFPGSVNVAEYGDNLLTGSRYVGVYRAKDNSADGVVLSGAGMESWLGDENGSGDVFETAVVLDAVGFGTAMAALLPPGGAITAGTFASLPGTYTGRHQWVTPRKALDYVTSIFGAEWRVNNNGTLDAGLVADLFATTPRAILVANTDSDDLRFKALPGQATMSRDNTEYTTRVVVLGEGEGETITVGTADAVSVPFNDLHGNDVVVTRVVSESYSEPTNVDTRAALILSQYGDVSPSVSLSTDRYDIKGDVAVGDYIYVYDPDHGFEDVANEVTWRGEIIHPVKLRVIELSWPIRSGWTVAYRDNAGVWTDLSPYVFYEGGSTSVVVGDLPRSITSGGGEPIGGRATVDTTTPAVPVFTTPFPTASYQSSAANDVRSSVLVQWSTPLNTDGSTILDGDHYEVRYRVTEQYNYPVTWAQAGTFQWNELQTWGRPLSNAAAEDGAWHVVFVGWGVNEVQIVDLTVAAEYEFQIRAVDASNPPHQSTWSASAFMTTQTDLIAPGTPAAPVVAASRIAIQVTHTLGLASGGTFNLPQDMDHIEVHVGGPVFFPDDSTRVGRLAVSSGMINAGIPVVGTFQIENVTDVWVKVVAVDRFGNRSSASEAATITVELIDTAHISDLVASKITAGTILADLILGAAIKTAESGTRVELNQYGLQAYDADGQVTTNISSDPGVTGQFISFSDGTDVVASINDAGVGSFTDVSVADSITIDGDDLVDDLLDPLPKGVIAWCDNGLSNSGFTTEVGFIEMSAEMSSLRCYKITCQANTTVSIASNRITFRIRDGGVSEPTLSSATIPGAGAYNTFGYPGTGTNVLAGPVVFIMNGPDDGLHRLLWTIQTIGGATGVINNPLMIIEDIGLTRTDTGIANDGSGGGVVPVTRYTKTYTATWSRGYDEDGDPDGTGTTDASQGYYSSLYGNQRGLIGFNSTTIKADTAGATIISCSVTLYYKHWYFASGGTAVLGTHNYTAQPGSWADSRVNQNRVTSASWPKPGKRTVSLGTTIGGEFKSGTACGIAVGPGITTSSTYYGRCAGTGSGSNTPVLTIVYDK